MMAVASLFRLRATWLIHWVGDATGVLLAAPLVLRFTDAVRLRDRNRIAEAWYSLIAAEREREQLISKTSSIGSGVREKLMTLC